MTTEKLEKLFELSRTDMQAIIKSFQSEMEAGLSGDKSSLKMIPTYVEMPTGNEKGKFVALDLGGTNFRVLELTLKGANRSDDPLIMKFALDKAHISGTAEIFFDFIADSVKTFIDKNKISGTSELNLGFTFSFPIKQTGIASGILMCWNKDFRVSGVVGSDVVRLMEEAFVRKGIRNIKISALVNDTVGTLVAKAYEEPDCDIGVIIGTGSNACYPEGE
jgi:hexokinase